MGTKHKSTPPKATTVGMGLRSHFSPGICSAFLFAACGTAGTPSTKQVQVVHDDRVAEGTGPSQAPPSDTGSNAAASFPAADQYAGSVLSYTVIDAPNGTFGYDILSDGKPFIHLTNLPGQPGNEGCKTKADAEKLAEFVLKKVQGGEMPPSITSEELSSLGILK